MIVGITIGDQAGIGREIIEKSIPLFPEVEFKIIGKIIDNVEYGKINSEIGKIAGDAIKEAVELALKGEIDAVVTAPIHKKAFNLGGWYYPGHTEMLASLTGTKDYAMMLIHGNLRVIHVTTHVSLRNALDLINAENILKKIKVADNACRQLGIKNPRIAVAALNPHSGDGGLFGNEEVDEIIPAINMAQRKGINIIDYPIPADIVFAKALGGEYDCVVAMYHDQGHIPVKTVGFKWDKEWIDVDGVNATFGLPIIRTSPDHGVAFGKAGKGTADPKSMISAIRIAIQLIKNRKENGHGKEKE